MVNAPSLPAPCLSMTRSFERFGAEKKRGAPKRNSRTRNIHRTTRQQGSRNTAGRPRGYDLFASRGWRDKNTGRSGGNYGGTRAERLVTESKAKMER